MAFLLIYNDIQSSDMIVEALPVTFFLSLVL
jgi:hypothetical protein